MGRSNALPPAPPAQFRVAGRPHALPPALAQRKGQAALWAGPVPCLLFPAASSSFAEQEVVACGPQSAAVPLPDQQPTPVIPWAPRSHQNSIYLILKDKTIPLTMENLFTSYSHNCLACMVCLAASPCLLGCIALPCAPLCLAWHHLVLHCIVGQQSSAVLPDAALLCPALALCCTAAAAAAAAVAAAAASTATALAAVAPHMRFTVLAGTARTDGQCFHRAGAAPCGPAVARWNLHVPCTKCISHNLCAASFRASASASACAPLLVCITKRQKETDTHTHSRTSPVPYCSAIAEAWPLLCGQVVLLTERGGVGSHS